MPVPTSLPALTPLTLGYFKSALRARLGVSSAYWGDAELGIYVVEALRTWNAAAAFWRDRGVFQTEAAAPFYDLSAKVPALLGYTIKDADLVTAMEYHVLEPPTPTVWTGTDMFTLAELTGTIERRRNQFLVETGAILTHYAPSILPPPVGRVQLQDSVIDVRRAAWKTPGGVYTHLWREDEHNLNAYAPGWSINPDTPSCYAMIASPTWRMQLAPVPIDEGTLDLLVVAAGATLDPATGIALGVPDDFAWVVKFGALADLLGKDGPARDSMRSAYCEKRYREGVQLARMWNTVIQAEINGVPVLPCSLHDLDGGYPGWQNSSGELTMIAMGGQNMLVVADVPDGVYSVTLDVVRNTPIPANDTDQLILGREEADVVLDYAEHLACFKLAGAEFEATMGHYERLFRLAAVHNERLRAQAANFGPLSKIAMREGKQRPRRKSDIELEPMEVTNA